VQDVAATKTKTSKRNASHFTRSMQTEAQRTVNALILYRHEHTIAPTLGCVFKLRISLVRGNFSSVRGYGLRTYKSRQGRNAATVV
jgi:hypothetical protein